MEYNSFYGGRQGRSFVIKKNFATVQQMCTNFALGGDYTQVKYDQYVLINTINKNNPDNGKLFRRGYDYNGGRQLITYVDSNNGPIQQSIDSGGAIYIGTIVGPSGSAPLIEMTTYQQAAQKAAAQGYSERRSYGSYSSPLNLVPGKVNDERYNDSIDWYCVSFVDSNSTESIAYIGFTIPYPVIDFSTTAISPYKNGSYTDTSIATREDDGTHPFYEKWNISIPRGIKGDAFKNFRIIDTLNENDVVLDWNTSQIYSGFTDDLNNGRSILVYDYYNYDEKENPEKKTYFIGDYNVITDFSLLNDGTLTITFSHNDTVSYNRLLKWVTNVSLSEDGTFTIAFNNGDPNYTTNLTWITNISVDELGVITRTYNNNTFDRLTNIIRWIKQISLLENGKFTVSYNDLTTFSTTLKWISDLSLEDNGKISLIYNTGAEKQLNNTIVWISNIDMTDQGKINVTYNTGDVNSFSQVIKWIKNIDISQNGTITIYYNNNTTLVLNKKIKWIDNVSIQTANNSGVIGTGDQKLHIKYNNQDSDIAIGQPLNYIIDCKISQSNYHLLFLYSDPVYRNSFPQNKKIWDSSIGMYWIDMGAVKTYGASFIGKVYDKSESTNFETVNGTIIFLRNAFPLGLTDTNQKGTIVAVRQVVASGENEVVNSQLYAFDYTTSNVNASGYRGWMHIGSTSSNSQSNSFLNVTVAKTIDQVDPNLPIGGIWFVSAQTFNIILDVDSGATAKASRQQIDSGGSSQITIKAVPGKKISSILKIDDQTGSVGINITISNNKNMSFVLSNIISDTTIRIRTQSDD